MFTSSNAYLHTKYRIRYNSGKLNALELGLILVRILEQCTLPGKSSALGVTSKWLPSGPAHSQMATGKVTDIYLPFLY